MDMAYLLPVSYSSTPAPTRVLEAPADAFLQRLPNRAPKTKNP
jgi:hypothetical protein